MKSYSRVDLKTALDTIEVVFQPENVKVVFQIIFVLYLTLLDIVQLTSKLI